MFGADNQLMFGRWFKHQQLTHEPAAFQCISAKALQTIPMVEASKPSFPDISVSENGVSPPDMYFVLGKMKENEDNPANLEVPKKSYQYLIHQKKP